MRLLLISNDYLPKPGGIQQYLGNLVERYDGPVQVIAPRDDGAARDAQVVRHRRRFMWPTRKTRRWIEEQAGRFNPDIILFGVKLWDTEEAARRIAPLIGPETGVIDKQEGATYFSVQVPVTAKPGTFSIVIRSPKLDIIEASVEVVRCMDP